MRGVRGELPLAPEGFIQAFQHAVQGARQPGKLVPPAMKPHAAAQIAAADDGFRRSGHAFHRPEGATRNQEAAQRREADHQRQQNQRHPEYRRIGRRLRVRRLDATHPH